jgi:hypothetical protein
MIAALSRRRSAPLETAPRAAPLARDSSRRDSSGTVLAIMVTMGVCVAAYSISTRVAAERHQLAELARENARLTEETLALEAELRVRMRLPQLQRWNDEILRLQPVAASQLLRKPVDVLVYANAAPKQMAATPRLVSAPFPAISNPDTPLLAGPAPAAPAPGLAPAPAPVPGPDPLPAVPQPPAVAPPPPAVILAPVEAALEAPATADLPESEH